jgi:hypothetical protein
MIQSSHHLFIADPDLKKDIKNYQRLYVDFAMIRA